jgi:hypothetical protein
MPRHYRILFVSIVLTTAVICAVVAAPTIARAQGQARLVTRNIITGTLEKSSVMNFDKALAVAMDTCIGREPVSCWLETRRHWFSPFHSHRIPIVHVRHIANTTAVKKP